MSDKSEIEWTDATWNPVRGCVKVSPGCKHCYAETFAERWRGIAGHPYEQGFDPRLVPDQLDAPLHWRKPRTIFVNSMSDLFGDFVSDDYIAAVFGVMAATRRHTYQVLTKRAERLPLWFSTIFGLENAEATVCREGERLGGVLWDGRGSAAHLYPRGALTHRLADRQPWPGWPLPNVHLGVSVEDRKYGLPRIDHLRRTPAAVRFLSIEPLLEDLGPLDLAGIHWVIVGGESGHGDVRPMHPDWVRSLRDQCIAQRVPFFFKQWGAWSPEIDRDRDDPDWRKDYRIDGNGRRILNLAGGHGFHGERVHLLAKVGKGKAGRLLDGRTWDEMPARSAP